MLCVAMPKPVGGAATPPTRNSGKVTTEKLVGIQTCSDPAYNNCLASSPVTKVLLCKGRSSAQPDSFSERHDRKAQYDRTDRLGESCVGWTQRKH